MEESTKEDIRSYNVLAVTICTIVMRTEEKLEYKGTGWIIQMKFNSKAAKITRQNARREEFYTNPIYFIVFKYEYEYK